ncbi:MAG: DUF4293 domain-containing protein [Bacteroidia bacterium]|jgi:hypothetical protein|nr:DUF4293 domain-containing protein [Bacteroidia bacterium]
MLQRIQTLFLAGVALITVILLFIPMYYAAGKGAPAPTLTLLSNVVALLVNLIPAGWAVFTIFRFNNRIQQIKFCTIGMLLSALVLALDIFLPGLLFNVPIELNATVSFAPGIYLVPANVLLFFLASRFIRRDEELVRSADRLR